MIASKSWHSQAGMSCHPQINRSHSPEMENLYLTDISRHWGHLCAKLQTPQKKGRESQIGPDYYFRDHGIAGGISQSKRNLLSEAEYHGIDHYVTKCRSLSEHSRVVAGAWDHFTNMSPPEKPAKFPINPKTSGLSYQNTEPSSF